jgi:hypothetical protein
MDTDTDMAAGWGSDLAAQPQPAEFRSLRQILYRLADLRKQL